MLYYLLYPLREQFIGFNLFRYITFRTFMATFTAMLIYFVFGKAIIRLLAAKQFWQTVRDDGPVTHMDKRGTPTMGGLLIWASVFASVFLWSKFMEPFVLAAIFVVVAFGIIGFIDDYRKVILKDPKGLRARFKFPLQIAVGTAAVLVLFDAIGLSRDLALPFFKELSPNLGWAYVPFAAIVIVGASNAVNLTDGLDGLVSVPSIVAFLAYAVLAYIAGHAAIANYLAVQSVPGAGELAVMCGAVVGACVGFLWYNAHPASIFMGDVGSLPLGALLGYIAVVTKNEVLLVFIGGIFVLETISVITQVVSFKLTGRRVFRMAPLHHHFELKGWSESKVIVRFWIIAIILALASLATLKLR
ncbi:MAG: phospho-N-acetylmuramoyl-pentapeptide-transferase [Proteobacteria bacterium]|nr:phospho-N-acetylmuramoyl-pentapeptide-transferase [Pseudomonadota bacterium]